MSHPVRRIIHLYELIALQLALPGGCDVIALLIRDEVTPLATNAFTLSFISSLKIEIAGREAELIG